MAADLYSVHMYIGISLPIQIALPLVLAPLIFPEPTRIPSILGSYDMASNALCVARGRRRGARAPAGRARAAPSFIEHMY